MINSNREKRFSHAAPSDLPNYGLINARGPGNVPHLKKLIQDHRNSHSLNHDFSQLYISNLKNQMDNQQSCTHRCSIDSNRNFEQMTSYKKEALELKKQMFQMEKSINFWSDCTEYWRNKWRKTRDEKNKLNEEVKQLRCRINKLEHQLKTSEDKRLRMGDEVNILNEELSRYMYRYEDDNCLNNNNNNRKQTNRSNHPIQYNSDRRVDYRKKHRRKDIKIKPSNNNNLESPPGSNSSSDLDNGNHVNHHHSYTMIQQQQSTKHGNIDQIPPNRLSSNSKIQFRHHERLLDKRIMNKKRFSQVVMLDEDEIVQMNKDMPNSSTLNSFNNNNNNNLNDDCDTLKTSHSNIVSDLNNNNNNDNYNNNRHRFMDFLPEDVEEEDCFDDDRIKPGQFFADDLDFDLATTTATTTKDEQNVDKTNDNDNDDDDDEV